MKPTYKQTVKWIALALCVGAVARAQAQDAESQKPGITVLAIGDRPEITLTTTQSGSTYNKPPEGEVPPEQLFVKDEKDGFRAITLELNAPGQPIPHPGGASMKLFAGESDPADPAKTPYVDIPLPEEKVDMTVFLLRDPDSKGWKKTPKVFPFKNDLVSFPMNSLRVINFSTSLVRARVGGVLFDLQPSASRFLSYPPKSVGYAVYQIGARVEGEPLLVADSAISYYPGTRLNIVVYDADGKEPGKPIRHVTFFERAMPTPTAP